MLISRAFKGHRAGKLLDENIFSRRVKRLFKSRITFIKKKIIKVFCDFGSIVSHFVDLFFHFQKSFEEL